MAVDFKNYLYTDDDGETHQIRINQFTFAAQVTDPAVGEATSKIQAKSSLGKRMFGLKPRYARLTRDAGASPDVKTYYTNLPILSPGDFGTLNTGSAVVVNGVNWRVLALVPEQQR